MENSDQKSEELDPEFLQELNTFTEQLKTDEEIQKDIKSKQIQNNNEQNKIKS